MINYRRCISIELPCILLSHTAKYSESGPRVLLHAKVVENATSFMKRVIEVVARVSRPTHTLQFWVNTLGFIAQCSEDYDGTIPWDDVAAWLNNLMRDRFKFEVVPAGLAQDQAESLKDPKVSVEPAQEPAETEKTEVEDGETAEEENKDGEKTEQQQHPAEKPTAEKPTAENSGDESTQEPDPEQESTAPEADGKPAKSPSSLLLLPQAKLL